MLETYLNLQQSAGLSGSQKQIGALRRWTVLTRKNLRAPPRASFFAADMQKVKYRAFTCAGIKEILEQGDSEESVSIYQSKNEGREGLNRR